MPQNFNDFNLFSKQAVVLDMGSAKTKAGLAGERKPSLVFNSIIGQLRYRQILNGNFKQETIDPVKDIISMYNIEELIDRGEFKDMSHFINYIEFIKDQLDLKSLNNTGVMFTEPPFMSQQKKKSMLEIMIENQDVLQLFFSQQAMLSMYGLGLLNGAIIESGEGVTQLSCLFNGQKIDYITDRINIGGKDLTSALRKALKTQGCNFSSNYDQFIYWEIKEKYCVIQSSSQISQQLNDKQKDFTEIQCALPDGQQINLFPQVYQVGELFFDWRVSQSNFWTFPEFVQQQIGELDIELKRMCYQNLVLSGGNTMTLGFTERFAREIEKLVGDNLPVSIIGVNDNRENLAWLGGSVISGMATFNQLWITKKDYQEYGASILMHKRLQIKLSK